MTDKKTLRGTLRAARDTFVASALTALQSHIDTFGEIAVVVVAGRPAGLQ